MFDQFYGLEARPFQLTPDPAYYFESITHRKALSYLGYGLAQGEGFVVITGEVGAGKSTLVAHLMSTIDSARLTAGHVVTSSLGGEEIIHVVARTFGLEVAGHDKATALGAIEHFFHEEARSGRRCLLIVDEAQNLSIEALEELRMLSNFQLGAHPLLQTLLLGQPEFRAMLLEHPELEQLRQRVIAAHHLEPMQAKEVQPYIEHRLKRAGWQGNPSFDARLFAEIYAATGGIPRRINQTLNRLLLLGAVEERSHIDGAMLAQILGELNDDGSIAIVSPQAPSERADFARKPKPQEAAPEQDASGQRSIDPVVLDTMLAERDAQIQELQQAVIELANAADERHDAQQAAIAELVADISRQIAELESRLSEQDRTVRHALTMIIEWIESDEALRAAA
ncbi:XrtA/PEP-CTERM system-associated ATPase [Novosphingobium sp. M1R2S20]|uniref:XrtA/PEP-CTERM system-associated ATPase n=1 Tax=Novosphingobium rhizovicinum TaxID=3228928 RepID=A0ABV3RFS5_9SPHN